MRLSKFAKLPRLLNAEPDEGGTGVVEIESEQPQEIQDGLQTEEETQTAQEVTGQDDGELVVTIGDGESPKEEAHAPEWVRELRKQYREAQKELRELKARQQVAPEIPVLGKKPTLDDFDYDTDKFEAALVNWHEQKRKVDQIAEQKAKEAEQQQKAWAERLNAYKAQKEALKVPDYDEAEASAQETFNQTQQGVILQGANNPALLVYTLWENPTRAKELAAITDPVKFSFAVAKLEAKLEEQLKTSQRKPTAAPERTLSSNAPVSGAVSNRLEALKAKADKTGDYSEYLAAKRAMKKS